MFLHRIFFTTCPKTINPVTGTKAANAFLCLQARKLERPSHTKTDPGAKLCPHLTHPPVMKTRSKCSNQKKKIVTKKKKVVTKLDSRLYGGRAQKKPSLTA